MHESIEEGFVTRIELRDTSGRLHEIWNAVDPTLCGGSLETSWPATAYEVKTVRVHTLADGFEEIDAVELIGMQAQPADGFGDACDNCPDLLNVGQTDGDLDGAGDACDCAPADGSTRPPGRIDDLRLTRPPLGAATLSWAAEVGADHYSVTRGDLDELAPDNYGPCLVTDVAGTSWVDGAEPSSGAAYVYLIQGSSTSCGTGSLGLDGDGGERRNLRGTACP